MFLTGGAPSDVRRVCNKMPLHRAQGDVARDDTCPCLTSQMLPEVLRRVSFLATKSPPIRPRAGAHGDEHDVPTGWHAARACRSALFGGNAAEPASTLEALGRLMRQEHVFYEGSGSFSSADIFMILSKVLIWARRCKIAKY